MVVKKFYPVQKLNKNITLILKKIVSSDVCGNIESGLENEIRLIDIEEHITDVASIVRNPLTGKDVVTLSVAYCQFFWLIADVSLKTLDRLIIEESSTAAGCTIQQFRQCIENINTKQSDFQHFDWTQYVNIDVNKYLSYLQTVPEILVDDFWEQMDEEYVHALSIISPNTDIDIEAIKAYSINSKYHERVNSVYCYGIAFILLHELSHHSLGHMSEKVQKDDEENADMSAFWSIFSDITGEASFSANIGMLLVFYSFMYLNPSLTEDDTHPREDKRLFAVFDEIVDENEKYTTLVVKCLDFWAKLNDIQDYPLNLPCKKESIKTIKDFFNNLGKQ